jgi:hypothetical protein
MQEKGRPRLSGRPFAVFEGTHKPVLALLRLVCVSSVLGRHLTIAVRRVDPEAATVAVPALRVPVVRLVGEVVELQIQAVVV